MLSVAKSFCKAALSHIGKAPGVIINASTNAKGMMMNLLKEGEPLNKLANTKVVQAVAAVLPAARNRKVTSPGLGGG